MLGNFNKALKFVLESEGGYVNHPNDPGGETKYGISKRSYPNEDIFNLTMERAAEIYREDYWDSVKGDELPSGIDYLVFDSSVNHGPKNAGTFLQKAANRQGLKLVVDGAIGPVTVKEVKRGNTELICTDILRERDIFYRKIVARDLSQSVFMKGWLNRLAEAAVNVRSFS